MLNYTMVLPTLHIPEIINFSIDVTDAPNRLIIVNPVQSADRTGDGGSSCTTIQISQATMLKKLKGKMKRRNTEPTMTTVGATGGGMGVSSVPALTLAVAPQENDEDAENNTDF